MLFIQTGIKSSFMRQIWRLQKYCLCHFGSYDKGISEIAKSYLRQCLHVQQLQQFLPVSRNMPMYLQITVCRGLSLHLNSGKN